MKSPTHYITDKNTNYSYLFQPETVDGYWLVKNELEDEWSATVLTGAQTLPWSYEQYNGEGELAESGDSLKQERYTQDGTDWIDICAEDLTPEEFRGAMKFTIGKYIRRLGKKDSIDSEVGKIADYANRWLEYEQKLD